MKNNKKLLKAIIASIAISSGSSVADETSSPILSYDEIAEKHSQLSSQNELLKLQVSNATMMREIENIKGSDFAKDNESLRSEISTKNARIEELQTQLEDALASLDKLKETPHIEEVAAIDRLTLVKISSLGAEPKATVVIDGQTNKNIEINDEIVSGVLLSDITKQSILVEFEENEYEILLRSYPTEVKRRSSQLIHSNKAKNSVTEVFSDNKMAPGTAPEGFDFYKKFD